MCETRAGTTPTMRPHRTNLQCACSLVSGSPGPRSGELGPGSGSMPCETRPGERRGAGAAMNVRYTVPTVGDDRRSGGAYCGLTPGRPTVTQLLTAMRPATTHHTDPAHPSPTHTLQTTPGNLTRARLGGVVVVHHAPNRTKCGDFAPPFFVFAIYLGAHCGGPCGMRAAKSEYTPQAHSHSQKPEANR